MVKLGKTGQSTTWGQARLKLRRYLVCGVLLLSVLVAGAYGQASATFTGKVAFAGTRVADGKFEIVLRLVEYPDNAFCIGLEDAPRFGLTNDQEIKSGAEFGQFTGNLDAMKGQTVKLTCVKMDSGGADYRVKALERLGGK
jgi:hypothetical protein